MDRYPEKNGNPSAQTEQALPESEARYRLLIKHSPDGIFIFDLRTSKILEVNDQFLKMLGYAEEDMSRLTLKDILILEDRAARISIQEMLENGQEVFGVRQYKRADGCVIDVEVGARLISSGDRQMVMVIVRDVTERRRVEKALKESEDRYRIIFETTACATVIIDEDMTLSLVNNEFERLSGRSKKEIEGNLSWIEFLEPKDVERIARYHYQRRVDPDQAPRNYEFQFVRRSGEKRTIFMTSALIPGTKKNIASLLDITDRVRAERALRDSDTRLRANKEELELMVAERTAELSKANERLTLALDKGKRVEQMMWKGAKLYKNLYDNSPLGMYRANPDGRLQMANPALARMLGYSSFPELSSADGRWGKYEPNYLEPEFRRCLDEGDRVRGYESAWKRPDGSVIFVRENARATRAPDGTVLYYEGTVEDITEQKEAEDKVQTYQEELRSLASELSFAEERERRRVAGVLHDDVGQLLAVSKIRLGSLVQTTLPGDVRTQIEEVRRLIEQAIGRTRSLTFELSHPVLHELGFAAAAEWLGEQMEKAHGFKFTFFNDDEPKPVDEEVGIFLFTSVRELLINIVKHADAHKVEISIAKNGEKMVVQVRDDGRGFLPEKADSRSKGFGLFSIKERLRHLGGHMSIDSGPGRGTVITLSAPAKINRGN